MSHRSILRLTWPLAAVVAFLGALAPLAHGHPLSQGSLDVVIHPGRVQVKARVTDDEVSVTNMLASDPSPPAAPGGSDEAYRQHARYLAAHLRITADGAVLSPKVIRTVPPQAGASAAANGQNPHATYELEYLIPSPPGGGAPDTAKPSKVELLHTALTDVVFTPGTKWEASYIVRIGVENRPASEGLLLVAGKPISFDCDWREPSTGDMSARSSVDRWRMFADFLGHGVEHILTGYDHLLFISALVLATRKLWDLLKVVTAFTIAHTLTLALAAMNWIHLPGRIIEPMIATSIVVVALQNVLWPQQCRGWRRLAAAFFFGLFHGLGFAGGLLDAMQNMPVSSTLLAIAAFSIGVEAGHQMIVIPLFGGLKLARRLRTDEPAKERLSVAAQRFGSAAISLAGMFYLIVALQMSFKS